MTQPRRKYTPEEATQMYLDRVKRSNPSPGVTAVIVEIEGEMAKSSGRRRSRHKTKARTPNVVPAR